MEKYKSETGDIIRLRAELKSLISDEKVVTAKVQKMRLQALKAKYAATKAEMLAAEWEKSSLPEPLIRLLQRNMALKKFRAKEAESLSMEADEVLNKIRESKRALIIRLAKATGFEPPPDVSEKDVEVSKEGQQLQSLSKELEEAEAALKEAVLEKDKKELELRNIKESIENKTKITEEEYVNYSGLKP